MTLEQLIALVASGMALARRRGIVSPLEAEIADLGIEIDPEWPNWKLFEGRDYMIKKIVEALNEG